MANDAQELYEHRHDSEEWEETPETIEVRPSRTSVLSVRLPKEEFEALEAAAAAMSLSLSRFVREAIIQKLRGAQIPTGVINKSIGYVESRAQTDDFKVWSQTTSKSSEVVTEPEPQSATK